MLESAEFLFIIYIFSLQTLFVHYECHLCLFRYPHIEKDHLVKLLKQLILGAAAPSQGVVSGNALNAAAVPTLLGTGSFSLLGSMFKLLRVIYLNM